ncbi:MAG: ATP-binding protein [Nitrospiraceae bacterium]|nr:ATP-binding protein [Nitrospiraceae bacterium]
MENILFMGYPGAGKTHLATALGHSACAQGKHVRFISLTGFVTQPLEAREERRLERFFEIVSRASICEQGVGQTAGTRA